jgi:hypothetical protein
MNKKYNAFLSHNSQDKTFDGKITLGLKMKHTCLYGWINGVLSTETPGRDAKKIKQIFVLSVACTNE